MTVNGPWGEASATAADAFAALAEVRTQLEGSGWRVAAGRGGCPARRVPERHGQRSRRDQGLRSATRKTGQGHHIHLRRR